MNQHDDRSDDRGRRRTRRAVLLGSAKLAAGGTLGLALARVGGGV